MLGIIPYAGIDLAVYEVSSAPHSGVDGQSERGGFSHLSLPADAEEHLPPAERRPQCRPGRPGPAGVWHRVQHLRPAGELPPGSGPDPHAGTR